MGLDMYLIARCFVYDNKEKAKIKISGIPGFDMKKFDAVEQEAIYWRKANAIHAWFVAKVQDDNDDCGKYDVSREQLAELLKEVEDVLSSRRNDNGATRKASKKLPPQSGFFFGSTDYDEYYWEELERTAKELKEVLKMPDCWGFYYTSSW